MLTEIIDRSSGQEAKKVWENHDFGSDSPEKTRLH
jgi:hypothetical protein